MRQAYLYFVWLKRLACLTNHSIELTGLCQRRHQTVRPAELFIFQGSYCCKKGKFFILKHKTMFGQPPVEKFRSFYSIYSAMVGSYHEILYTNCHVTQIQQQDIQLVRDQNEWMQSYIRQVSTVKTQMNFVLLLLFGRFGRQGSIENVCNFAKVSYFWGFFFHIFMGKMNAKCTF